MGIMLINPLSSRPTMLEKEIGQRIRRIRTEKGITLENLSSRTGMTTGYLSKVERGLSSLPIATLGKIVNALQIQMADIFEERSNDLKLSILYPEERRVVNPVDRSVCYNYQPLASHLRNKFMEPFIVTLRPYCVEKKMFEHEGEEMIYLLEGKMDFYYGSEIYVVEEVGTCLYFDASVPHKGQCRGDREAKFLTVIVMTVLEHTGYSK